MLLEEKEQFRIINADCISHMHSMPRQSVDMSIYSPPFPSVFSYQSSAKDIGNSEDLASEAPLHFSFFYKAMLPIIKPGRVMLVHCTQIPRLKRSGEFGLFDFRGLLIRLGIRAGFTYDYDWLIPVDPQMQALRTKKWELKFQGLETDRSQSRGAISDYLIKFRAPGENRVPINSKGEVSRNDWIAWAESYWEGIKRTRTLNTAEAKGMGDTRHIAALQLDLIEIGIKLFSNPGETVFTPFAGIGSEVYQAIKLGRRGYGVELKSEYFNAAIKNCNKAVESKKQEQSDLFSLFAEKESQ